MNAGVKLVAVVLAGIPVVGMAQEEAKLSCVKDVVYSQEFIKRYPKAGAACQEVVMKDGKKWARFDAEVVGVKGSEVTVNFKDSYNQPVATLTFSSSPDARVKVEGREVKYSTLKTGDTLSFWMPESRMGFYAEPGASESTKLALVENTAKQR